MDKRAHPDLFEVAGAGAGGKRSKVERCQRGDDRSLRDAHSSCDERGPDASGHALDLITRVLAERGPVVGTHTPRAASIIGANTPGCIVKRSVCAHCRVHGHDEFECPLLFAKVHGKRMPGHMMDGRKDAAGWDGECITRETAIEWLRMQQHGYFFKSWSEHETGEKVESAEGGETPAVRASTCDSGDEDDCIITRVEVEQDATAGAGFGRGRGQPDEPHCEHRSGDNDQPASWVCHHTDKWLCFEEGVRNRDRGFWSGLELDRIKASITYWRAKDPVVFHVCPRLPGCTRAWHVLVQDARMRWQTSKCSRKLTGAFEPRPCRRQRLARDWTKKWPKISTSPSVCSANARLHTRRCSGAPV